MSASADRFEREVHDIALCMGVNPGRVTAALTGDEDCTALEFVEAFVDALDRDNAAAFEDWQHAEAQVRECYRSAGL